MENTITNLLAGTSVIFMDESNDELREVRFISGKPSLRDLIIVLSFRGWNENSPLYFLGYDDEDKTFMVMDGPDFLALMSKELCELLQDYFDCTFLTHKECEELFAQAE